MLRREQGFTLIEILVVITIIAALVGMVTLVIPKGQEAKNRVQCMNNLRQIGALLVTKNAGSGVIPYSGAAFVLQVANEIGDEDLDDDFWIYLADCTDGFTEMLGSAVFQVVAGYGGDGTNIAPGCQQEANRTDTQTRSLIGGNPNLTPETADTYTAGFVFTPEIGGNDLSFIVDYWKIELEDSISSFGVQFTLDQCYVESGNRLHKT